MGFEVRPLKQIRGNTSRPCSIKIALLVTDQKAIAHLHRIPGKQSVDHSRLRLTAVTQTSKSLYPPIEVMWAEFEGVDMRPDIGELVRHPFVQTSNMALLVKSPGNT